MMEEKHFHVFSVLQDSFGYFISIEFSHTFLSSVVWPIYGILDHSLTKIRSRFDAKWGRDPQKIVESAPYVHP